MNEINEDTLLESFPIRELSARCNVNTVTIRAWERRYGLLTPMRTEKGHRLYTDNDVKRIKKILEWIDRGVPVSKVKALLDQSTPQTRHSIEAEAEADNWKDHTQKLKQAAQTLCATKIEPLLHDYFLNYPVKVVLEKVLSSCLSELSSENNEDNTHLAAVHFLESEIIRYALIRLSAHKGGKKHSKKAKTEKPSILLLCAEQTALWKLAVIAMALADQHYAAQLINQSCDTETWLAFTKSSNADQIVVYQDGIWREPDAKQIKDQQDHLDQQANRITFCGSAVIASDLNLNNACFSNLEQWLDQLPKTVEWN